MEAWGSWVVNNNLYINTLTINKRENVPIRVKLRKACTDRQGIIVSVCMSKLLKNHKKDYSVHDKFHRTLILSGFCFLKIAKISLNSSFFPKPIKR
ncbi:antiterminator Q family protein [Proteus mirabilis]|uniref:antiterminator Q family protein n=1 Tax=Proteus mirabilis TaxID=584 RepID=UPI003C6DD92F